MFQVGFGGGGGGVGGGVGGDGKRGERGPETPVSAFQIFLGGSGGSGGVDAGGSGHGGDVDTRAGGPVGDSPGAAAPFAPPLTVRELAVFCCYGHVGEAGTAVAVQICGGLRRQTTAKKYALKVGFSCRQGLKPHALQVLQ